MVDYIKKLVFEFGTRTSRIGFSDESEPRHIFPTVVGRLVNSNAISTAARKNLLYVGNETLEREEKLKLSYPIQSGRIYDWDVMEKIINYSFTLLKIEPNVCLVLFILPAHTDLVDQEKITNIMFDHFNVAGIYFSYREVLALYGSIGDNFIVNKDDKDIKTAFLSQNATGIIVHIDFDRIYIVPIYLAYVVLHSIKILEYGSRDIAIYLKDLLKEEGNKINYPDDLEYLHEITTKKCFISEKPDDKEKLLLDDRNKKTLYNLRNGKSMEIGYELSQAPEILFNPFLVGIAEVALDSAISFAIYNTDEKIQEELYNNIVLTGECSDMLGLRARLNYQLEEKFEQLLKAPKLNKNELEKYINSAFEILDNPSIYSKKFKLYNIKINPVCDNNFAWKGGSYIISIKAFQKLWIYQEDYMTKGVQIIRTMTKK